MAYITPDAQEEKLLEYPELFNTPIVRNGKEATVGYCCLLYTSKRVGPHLQKCLSRGKEHAAVLRQRIQPGDQGLSRGVLPVNDDPGLLSPLPCNAANTRGSAHGVHIRKGVAHDVDPVSYTPLWVSLQAFIRSS